LRSSNNDADDCGTGDDIGVVTPVVAAGPVAIDGVEAVGVLAGGGNNEEDEDYDTPLLVVADEDESVRDGTAGELPDAGVVLPPTIDEVDDDDEAVTGVVAIGRAAGVGNPDDDEVDTDNDGADRGIDAMAAAVAVLLVPLLLLDDVEADGAAVATDVDATSA
jgi:hypothetical protein